MTMIELVVFTNTQNNLLHMELAHMDRPSIGRVAELFFLTPESPEE